MEVVSQSTWIIGKKDKPSLGLHCPMKAGGKLEHLFSNSLEDGRISHLHLCHQIGSEVLSLFGLGLGWWWWWWWWCGV